MPDRTTTATRYLYLARHAEAASPGGPGGPDGSALTAAGRRQATETARLVGEQLGGVAVTVCEEAGDYVPYVPSAGELPADSAALTVLRFAPGRPSSVLLLNDQGHLPEELRWTCFPPELRV
ncbi:hypothetical protein [Kitasatospora sp. NPDC094011]|uniref:hypothetical protein n=1 Tax=Kitasatospora sp. NPDC094011 TaxID=3364090 RepID=UPI003808B102